MFEQILNFGRLRKSATLGLALFGAPLLFTACGGEGNPTVRPQQNAILDLRTNNPDTTQTTMQKAMFRDVSLATISALHEKREEIAKEIDSSGVSEDRLLEIAGNYAPYLLQGPYLLSNKNTTSDEFKSGLINMNSAILKAYSKDSERVLSSGILDQYKIVMFENCTSDLKSCKNMDFFRNSNKSSEVLLLIAARQEKKIDGLRKGRTPEYFSSVFDLYKVYKAVNDSMNRELNIEYYLRQVRYSTDIFEYYKNLPAKERADRKEEQRIHRDFLATALVILKNAEGAKDTYCNFIIDLKPYTINISKPDGNAQLGIQSMINEFINCATKQNKLDSLISTYMGEEKERLVAAAKDTTADNKDMKIKDLSYYYAVGFLKRTPQIFKNLNIKDDERSDLPFYVIDRLFYDAIDQNMAIEYWKQIQNPNDRELMEFVKNYIKTQIAYTLKSTQEILSKALADEYKKRGGLSSDLYAQVVEVVNQNTQFEWEALKARVRILRGFMVPVFDGKYKRVDLVGAEKKTGEYYTALQEELDQLDQHLNLVATSPMMFAMSYYMSKAPGQIKVTVSWWKGANQFFNIDGSNALASFFDDRNASSRFFSFGTPSFRYDEFEMKHVFDFILRTGIFDTISFAITNEDKGYLRIKGADNLNGEWLFFRQYIDNLLRKHTMGVADSIDSIDRLMQNQEFVVRFQNVCADPLRTPARLDVDHLAYNPMMDDKFFKEGVSKFYDSFGRMEVMRSDREKVVQLLDIMKANFRAPDAEARMSKEKFEHREEIIKLVENELERYYKLERDIQRKVKQADEFVVNSQRNCFLRLHHAEILRENTLYLTNVDFFKDVHAAVTLLNLFPEQLTEQNLAEKMAPDNTPEPEIACGITATAPAGDGSSLLSANLLSYGGKLITKWNTSPVASSLDPKSRGDIYARMCKVLQVSLRPEILELTASINGSDPSALGSRVESSISGMFMPQNIRPNYAVIDGKTQEWGVYVSGIESYAQSKQLILPKSLLSRKGFRHGKRDTALRMRRELQTVRINALYAKQYIGLPVNEEEKTSLANQTVALAPELDVPLGTFQELAGNSFWTGNDSMDVNFQPDQTGFVKEAMSHFGGDNRNGNQFVSWHSSSDTFGLSYLKSRMSFLMNIYYKNGIEISDSNQRECDENEWKDIVPRPGNDKCKIWKVGINDILRERLNIVNLYKLDATEMEILDWIGRTGRYTDAVLGGFRYKDLDDTKDWTYFDQFYKSKFTTFQGTRLDGSTVAVDKIEGSGQYDGFRDSLKLRIGGNRHLFGLNKYVTQFDRNRLRHPIIQHFDQVQEVEEAIRDQEDAKVQLGDIIFDRVRNARTDSQYFQFNGNDWRYITVKNRVGGDRDGTPILLGDGPDSAKSWFRNIVQDFIIKETDCDAMPQNGDPDFKALNPEEQKSLTEVADCRARYDVWQQIIDKHREDARQIRRSAASR